MAHSLTHTPFLLHIAFLYLPPPCNSLPSISSILHSPRSIHLLLPTLHPSSASHVASISCFPCSIHLPLLTLKICNTSMRSLMHPNHCEIPFPITMNYYNNIIIIIIILKKHSKLLKFCNNKLVLWMKKIIVKIQI